MIIFASIFQAFSMILHWMDSNNLMSTFVHMIAHQATSHYLSHCWPICCCLLLLTSMLWHRQPIFKLKGDRLSSSIECRIWTRVFGTKSPAIILVIVDLYFVASLHHYDYKTMLKQAKDVRKLKNINPDQWVYESYLLWRIYTKVLKFRHSWGQFEPTW